MGIQLDKCDFLNIKMFQDDMKYSDPLGQSS